MKKNKGATKGRKIQISFYKKVKCWYAEVPEHTEAQNLMVQGADELCEVMAQGHKRVSIEMTISENPLPHLDCKAIVALEKIEQTNWGATYRINAGKGNEGLEKLLPPMCWLCNVTKTVCGGSHPMFVYVTKILPNDEKPYHGVRR